MDSLLKSRKEALLSRKLDPRVHLLAYKREGRNGWTLDMFEGRAPGRFPEVLDVDGEPKRGVKDDPKDFACLER